MTVACLVICVKPNVPLNKIPSFFSNNNYGIDREVSYEDAFPRSYSVFTSNSDERSLDEVPVFLDLTGMETEFVSLALTNCLNLTKTSIYSKDKKQEVSTINDNQALLKMLMYLYFLRCQNIKETSSAPILCVPSQRSSIKTEK